MKVKRDGQHRSVTSAYEKRNIFIFIFLDEPRVYIINILTAKWLSSASLWPSCCCSELIIRWLKWGSFMLPVLFQIVFFLCESHLEDNYSNESTRIGLKKKKQDQLRVIRKYENAERRYASRQVKRNRKKYHRLECLGNGLHTRRRNRNTHMDGSWCKGTTTRQRENEGTYNERSPRCLSWIAMILGSTSMGLAVYRYVFVSIQTNIARLLYGALLNI